MPYPFAVDNHQYFNARILEERNAAIIIDQSEGVDKLFEVLKKFDRKKWVLDTENNRRVQLELTTFEDFEELEKFREDKKFKK